MHYSSARYCIVGTNSVASIFRLDFRTMKCDSMLNNVVNIDLGIVRASLSILITRYTLKEKHYG